MTKLSVNVGCFNKKLPSPFINVDIRGDVNPDVIDNCYLTKFEKGSIELIYCSHVLEHLQFKETQLVLKKWRELLCPGGILRLAVPDLEAIFAHYFYHKDLKVLKHMLYGSQKHDYDFHLNGWDFDSLKSELSSAGYNSIEKWDWRTTPPHSYCDDYSQAYWPHMDKTNGKLMSLNVQCRK